MTERYAVIGHPVAHSKSPLIHAAFAKQTSQDLAYLTIDAAPSQFESAVREFRADGGLGLNVTVPFKHRAYALCDQRSARAEEALAVNTLSFADRIIGDNTDGVGLVRDITSNLGCTIAGRTVLLMGAGGAACGVLGPLLAQAPARLVVVNRTAEKAIALCNRFENAAASSRVSARTYGSLTGESFDIVINATSAGLDAKMPPLPSGVFARGALAYDMLYGKTTPFLAFALREGARAVEGTGMLVEQAAESFYVWRGVRPDTGPVIAMLESRGR